MSVDMKLAAPRVPTAVAAATTVEIAVEADSRWVPDAVWKSLEGSAGSDDPRKPLKEILVQKLQGKAAVSDVYSVRRAPKAKAASAGDVIMAVMRVKRASQEAVLRISGEEGCFFRDVFRTDASRKEFEVVWLPDRKLDEALSEARMHEGALGLARNQRGLGIRVAAAHASTVRAAIIGAEAAAEVEGSVYEVQGLPVAFDSDAVEVFLQQIAWHGAKAIHSRQPRGATRMWRVRATAAPPGTVFQGDDGLVTIREAASRTPAPRRLERWVGPAAQPEAWPKPHSSNGGKPGDDPWRQEAASAHREWQADALRGTAGRPGRRAGAGSASPGGCKDLEARLAVAQRAMQQQMDAQMEQFMQMQRQMQQQMQEQMQQFRAMIAEADGGRPAPGDGRAPWADAADDEEAAMAAGDDRIFVEQIAQGQAALESRRPPPSGADRYAPH